MAARVRRGAKDRTAREIVGTQVRSDVAASANASASASAQVLVQGSIDIDPGNIGTWIDTVCKNYDINIAQKRAMLIFFASCARILIDELTPQVARRCIKDCCRANGCARIGARNIADAYDIIAQIVRADGVRNIVANGCARVHAQSLRCIEAILARIVPIKYSRAGNRIAEFAQTARELPARIFNSIDSETREDTTILPVIAVSARDIDIVQADIIIYNALGMAPIARILDNQFARACSKKEGTTIIVISDFDISTRVWSNVDKTSDRDNVERVSIICHSERKLSALFDIIVT